MNAALALDLFQPTETYTPRDWQIDDIVRMKDNPISADWSEMGCFKTTTGLWLAQERNVKNLLVVTSKNGKGTYFDAVPKALEGWQLYNMNLGKMTRLLDVNFQPEVDEDEILMTIKAGKHAEPWIILIHYDCFITRHSDKYKIVEKLGKINWDMHLCDEAHKLKNKDTSWVKNIKKLRSKTRHIMTGSGFINNPAEMWSLLHFLDRIEYSSYWRFRGRYCDEILENGFRIIRGLKKHRVAEFRALRENLGPRHTMDEVHKDIGQPIESVREVKLNPEQKRMYADIKAILSTLDQQGQRLDSPNVLSQLNRLRQICVATPQVNSRQFTGTRMATDVSLVEPSAKLDAVMDILEELRWDEESKQQVVIFSNFKDPLYLLEERFKEQRAKNGRLLREAIPYLHMQQKHSETERYRMWHDTFPRKEHRVFMSTLALGGESINLTPAQYLIFLDRSWSPKDMMQAIGRVYRPGQKHIPEIIYINAKGTVDGYIKSKLDRKQRWFQEIFGT